MDTLLWLGLFLVFLIAEAVTVDLISVWFAGGSLVALIASLFMGDDTLWIQILLALVVSLVCLLLTRPMVRKWQTKHRDVTTNFDRIIGMTGVVTERIDDLGGTGYVSVDGKEWMARTGKEDRIVEPGTRVKVLCIEGAKIFVEPEKTNTTEKN